MNATPTPAVDELQRQVERASLFTHTALGESYQRVGELQAFVHGLADALLARGAIDDQALAAAIEHARAELRQRGELAGPGAVVRVDADPVPPPARVDCAARLQVCKAVCCRLDFALSVGEVEAGRVKWDLGRPYFVRHAADGCCTHLGPQARGCGVYADRPQVCRHYDCTGDARIWKDFAKMELNDEWIGAHLTAEPGPRALRVLMHEPATVGKEP
jgi:Fe-S-cluster containining protein